MNKKQYATVILLVLIGVLLYLSKFYLDGLVKKTGFKDDPNEMLTSFVNSVKGDPAYDKRAFEVKDRISIHHSSNGDYYSVSNQGRCFVYYLSESEPREVEPSLCQ